MTTIDSRAVVDPKAELHDSVVVGPYAVIGADVQIGAGTEIGPHVVISGPCSIGERNKFSPFASIGGDPQDKKYAGEPTRLEIGDDNTVHEYVTISRGTAQDEGLTALGSRNWIMAYCHIAHDCMLGSDIIMSNTAQLAGHVHLGDHVIMAGFAKAHQFVKVGHHAFVGMDCTIGQDVPPYVLAGGIPPAPRTINSEGLKRRGFDDQQLRSLKEAYRIIYRRNLKLDQAMTELNAGIADNPLWAEMVAFIEGSERGLLR